MSKFYTLPKRLPVTRQWRKSRSKRTYLIDFALGKAEVRLLSTFVYRPSMEAIGGRVYRVEDVKTGRQDVVGVEFLIKC